jgi:MarR family transcriptional regulator, organic hydroperoxide resistance regulator
MVLDLQTRYAAGRLRWMGMTDLLDLFHQLVRFETELWNAVDARLRSEFDLPLSRLEPMQVIAGRPSCRVYDIAEELSITIGGTSKLVDRIEAAGYCVRRANPDDRRSSIIELTAAGRRVLAKATKVFESELRTRIGSAMPERSLQQFYSTVVKLRAANISADDEARSSA